MHRTSETCGEIFMPWGERPVGISEDALRTISFERLSEIVRPKGRKDWRESVKDRSEVCRTVWKQVFLGQKM